MKSWMFTAMLASAMIVPLGAASQGERLPDKELKSLIESVQKKAERFKDALDSQLRKGVIRSATSEVDVESYLEDFGKDIDLLKERLDTNYSASAEALPLLRRGSDIHYYVKKSPGLKGTSEWDTLAADLTRLAAAYGASFPLPSSVESVRRLNDRELATAAADVAASTVGFRKALESEAKRLPEADRGAARATAKDAEQLEKTAKALKDRLSDGKPTSAEVRALMDNAARIDAYVAGKTLGAASDWTRVTANLQKLAQGFGLPWRGGTQ